MIATTLLIAVALAAEPSSADPCIGIDDDGSTFPTCFDPGEGLELGVGAASRTIDGPGGGAALQLRTGILLRTERASRSKRDSQWFTEHRLLRITAQPAAPLREITATLFEGTYRRHLEEGFILIPTPRPTRLPFPFDLALHARLGTVERRVYDGPGARLEVGRVAVMLDPVRSESGRVQLAVGPAMSYGLRTDGREWVHELSPFTSGIVDVRFEDAEGWWNARLGGIFGWVAVPGGGTFFRASGEAHVERLVFALNDQPIWVHLSARAAQRDAGVFRGTELVGSVGLVMRAFQ